MSIGAEIEQFILQTIKRILKIQWESWVPLPPPPSGYASDYNDEHYRMNTRKKERIFMTVDIKPFIVVVYGDRACERSWKVSGCQNIKRSGMKRSSEREQSSEQAKSESDAQSPLYSKTIPHSLNRFV